MASDRFRLNHRQQAAPSTPFRHLTLAEREVISQMHVTVEILPDTFVICRLDPVAPVPDWAQGDFVSITRTPEELSVVCRQVHVPDDVRREAGWRCLRLAGQFDLSEVGVLASLTAPLAEAKVSLFVVATFDTDYLLVTEANLDDALRALEGAGHTVRRREV